MTLRYSVIEIYTSEEVRCKKQVVHEAVIEYVRGLKIAARCMVVRGTDACYENGEVVTQQVMNLSYNMPVRIEIILPSAELARTLPALEEMVCEGLVGVRELSVICHKTRKRLFPRQIRVRDVMTPSPQTVTESTPADAVVRLLLSSNFTGLPVVDAGNRPVGIISQGDLLYRAKMPMRLGLLAKSGPEDLAAVLESLSGLTAAEIMTRPDIHIQEQELLTGAVALMLEKGVKRLPVVDAWGRLTGVLSRMDIFQTIARESPDWDAIRQRNVRVGNLHFVSDIMRRDTQTVQPGTSVEEVIRVIDSDDIQRVAVVDEKGCFQGLISDGDLLSAFSGDEPGMLAFLTRLIPFAEKKKRQAELSRKLRGKTAAEVMRTDRITVREDTRIDEAIALMTEKELKRLTVVDADGKFKGLISRDALLRAGFSES
ncbi:histidine kinase [Desulfonema ishimotonii]|uniref:Histidine kinase n=1 Tax=Desulfonema ishimotonii TaxID=45657 RepID=A0A401FYM9_9BACT|nr:DUF190 domain-containing protein [Desulfonema ishimotonii]GBC62053.1 histidine kinase [Desulfonema ishimotonii]